MVGPVQRKYNSGLTRRVCMVGPVQRKYNSGLTRRVYMVGLVQMLGFFFLLIVIFFGLVA